MMRLVPKPENPAEEKGVEAEVTQAEWEEGFLEFWKLYPRKVARLDALKAWRRIKPRKESTFNEILDWLERACAVFEKREREKIPYAATVLNGRRWEDEEV